MEVNSSSEQRRPVSRPISPIPRRQLGTLPVNQRSYSRYSSKGLYGDDSPLMSPLPYYPRRRSVAFAETSHHREDRPHYGAVYSMSAPPSPARENSPPPVPILKTQSSYPDEAATSGAVPFASSAAAAAAAHAAVKGSGRLSPVPQRGRSNSRQRIAARRREAQLHHSFYDDSFVEEFVLSSKTQLQEEEKEAERQRRLEVELHAEKAKMKQAEQQVVASSEKLSAIQHAKDVLMAATRRRKPSVTPSPSRSAASSVPVTQQPGGQNREMPNTAVPAASVSSAAVAHTVPARSGGRPRRQSMPIVSEDVLAEAEDADAEGRDHAEDLDQHRAELQKRAKIEKVVTNLLSKQRKSKSKRSVVVINWSDMDSSSDGEAEAETAAEEAEVEEEKVTDGRKRGRGRVAKSRSATLPSEASLHRSTRAATRPPSSQRTASLRRRNASVIPEFSDSILFEEEENQPILLPRRQRTRPAPTRSIPPIEEEADDDILLSDEPSAAMVRRPPRRNTTRSTRQRAPNARGAAAALNHHFASAQPMGTRDDGQEMEEEGVEEVAVPAPRRRRPQAPRVDPNDPMAVFFDAAFPSPSKFDEMMMQAGGLPEARRGGGRGRGRGGRGHQPTLVLPSSIWRHR